MKPIISKLTIILYSLASSSFFIGADKNCWTHEMLRVNWWSILRLLFRLKEKYSCIGVYFKLDDSPLVYHSFISSSSSFSFHLIKANACKFFLLSSVVTTVYQVHKCNLVLVHLGFWDNNSDKHKQIIEIFIFELSDRAFLNQNCWNSVFFEHTLQIPSKFETKVQYLKWWFLPIFRPKVRKCNEFFIVRISVCKGSEICLNVTERIFNIFKIFDSILEMMISSVVLF